MKVIGFYTEDEPVVSGLATPFSTFPLHIPAWDSLIAFLKNNRLNNKRDDFSREERPVKTVQPHSTYLETYFSVRNLVPMISRDYFWRELIQCPFIVDPGWLVRSDPIRSGFCQRPGPREPSLKSLLVFEHSTELNLH